MAVDSDSEDVGQTKGEWALGQDNDTGPIYLSQNPKQIQKTEKDDSIPRGGGMGG